jgi:uncharacterized protein (TIGR00290 family)
MQLPGESLNREKTMQKKKAVLFWSGGKDCAYALYLLQQLGHVSVDRLFVTLNREKQISMHGVDKTLIEMQAESIGIPAEFATLPQNPSNDEYETVLAAAAQAWRSDGIENVVFGDIFLQDVRKYRENLFRKTGLNIQFPLWEKDTDTLSEEFLRDGFRAKIVSTDSAKLDDSFAGRDYDESFLQSLPQNVDPCGENGEFHTFVYDGPVFSNPISVRCRDIRAAFFPSPENPSEKVRFAFARLFLE